MMDPWREGVLDTLKPQFRDAILDWIEEQVRILHSARSTLLECVVPFVVAHYGSPSGVRRAIGVTGEKELATLLLAARGIFEIQLAAINDGFTEVLARREPHGV